MRNQDPGNLVSEVVTHTNEYASQCINGSTRRSGMAEWRPIDNLEIRKFFGLHFLFKNSGATVSGDSTLYYNLLIHRYPTINIEKVVLMTSQELLTSLQIIASQQIIAPS